MPIIRSDGCDVDHAGAVAVADVDDDVDVDVDDANIAINPVDVTGDIRCL